MEYYITQPKDYWIASTAVNISLNALGEKNRIQGSVASGAVIMCFVEGIKAESEGGEPGNGDGLWYGANHEPKRWPLSVSPTYFNSDDRKYVYAAIPRSASVGSQAVIVFPSEQLDIYGRAKRIQDETETYVQVGSEDYFYVYLQGIISAPYVNPHTYKEERTWEQEITDWGKLDTAQGLDEKLNNSDWFSYSQLTGVVTFLKEIVMREGSSFRNLILRNKALNGVATSATPEEFVDSEELVATPSYIQANYLRRNAEDTAQEQIGFLKGLWIKAQEMYGISADGVAKFKSLFAEDVNTKRIQANEMQSSNYSGDGINDTGWRLTNNHNGHSKLTVDELYVRMKAVFESLEIKKEMVTGGNQIFSRAANVICRTDYFDSNDERIGYSEVEVPWMLRGLSMVLSKRILTGIYSKVSSVRVNISDTSQIAYIRCYFLAEEGGRKVNNLWSVTNGHDLARCQTFNLNRSERQTYVDGEDVKLGNVFWWRKVIAVSSNSSPVEIDGKKYHYFDVSNQSGGYMAGSDLPCAGDDVSQWGNDADESRMNLVTIEVDGGAAIKAYEGIYTFDMSKCWYGGNPCKMNLSPHNEYRFTGRSFKIETEYGVRPVPVDIDADWSAQTKSRAEYAETGISVGDLIVKNYYYDRVPHNGSLWLCLFSGNSYWARYAKYDHGWITYVTEDVFNTLTDSQKVYVKVNGRTGLDDNQVCRRQEYTPVEPGTNSAVWQQEVAKGQNGIDAQDVEWVYIRTKTNAAPVILSDDTYEDSNGNDYTHDGHLPHVSGNANIENNENAYECTGEPKGIDDTWKYEWEIKRSKGAASDGHRAWSYYQGAMTLHGNYAESAFIIDTDNDNDQFATDSDSKVLLQQVRKTTVALYDGATQQTLTTLTASLIYEDGTSVPSSVATVATAPATGIVEITVLQNSTANAHTEIRAVISATCARGSKQTTFTLRKMMGGQPGLTPVIYQLAPTSKVFSFSRNSSNGLTPANRTSKINVSRTEGNTTTILSTAQPDITFTWGFDGESPKGIEQVGATITVSALNASLHYQVWIELSTGDREVLPIIKDGANGAKGDTPMQAYQWNQSATVAPSPLPSGATLRNWSLTAPARPSTAGDHFLWMTETVKHTAADGTVTYDTWSAATRVSGDTGADGDDAVNIVVSPASLIVNQDLNNPDNLSNLTQTFVVAVYKGNVAQTVNSISFVSEVASVQPTTYKGLFLNNSSQMVGAGTVNGNILTLKRINTYTEDDQTLYYDNLYADLTVNYGSSQTITARIHIYANLLGSWKEKVEADTQTAIATSINYLYDPRNPDRVVKLTNYAEYVRSSTEAISTINKKIDNGKNLVPITDGWESYEGAEVEYDVSNFGVHDEGEDLYSPAIQMESGKHYCFSAYMSEATGTDAYGWFLCYGDSYTHLSELYDSGHRHITLTKVPTDKITVGGRTYYRYYYHIYPTSALAGLYACINYADSAMLYCPQFEESEAPTNFAPTGIETSSQIKQTAESIDLSVVDVKRNLETAGVHLDGQNSVINLKAGKVNFVDPQGDPYQIPKIVVDPTTGKLIAIDGYFSGEINAERGTFKGQLVGATGTFSSGISSVDDFIQLTSSKIVDGVEWRGLAVMNKENDLLDLGDLATIGGRVYANDRSFGRIALAKRVMRSSGSSTTVITTIPIILDADDGSVEAKRVDAENVNAEKVTLSSALQVNGLSGNYVHIYNPNDPNNPNANHIIEPLSNTILVTVGAYFYLPTYTYLSGKLGTNAFAFEMTIIADQNVNGYDVKGRNNQVPASSDCPYLISNDGDVMSNFYMEEGDVLTLMIVSTGASYKAFIKSHRD